jgi:hypothetical protein
LKVEDLYKFDWICRDESSHTRKLVSEMFEDMGVECNTFKIKSVVGSSTAVKHTVLKSPKTERPTLSIISKNIIADEVQSGLIYEARFKNHKLKRKLYIAYLKERKHDAFIESVVNYLMNF